MTILLILPLLLGNFVEKWVIPNGMSGECGRLLIGDTDRDGNQEFYIRTYGGSQKILMYELHLPDTWNIDSFPYLYSPLIWDIGDFDVDGLSDIVIEASATQGYPTMVISVAESPDSFSYPTQEVWRDTVGFPLVTPICVYDIDQDSLPEIVKVCGYYTDLEIYEAIGNNLYEHITTVTTASTHTPSSTLAFGDFDQDNQNEYTWGYSGGEYSICECIGNNSYQEVLLQQLPTANIKDCFAVPDADGDGKLEFVVKGFVIPTGEIHAFIFEATGDNTYEIIKTFTLLGGDYYGGYSDVGDVDGDGIPEIALEGRQTVFIIKAAGNDSFYVWAALPGNSSGSSVRVFDVDGNGLSEVIISGNDQTKIYEYQVGIAETTASEIQNATLTVYPNPFKNCTNIRFTVPPEVESRKNTVVSMKIYDPTGRLVKSLYPESGIMNHGSVFVWDGIDDQGRAVPQGIYFLRLDNPDSDDILCQKVLRVK
jgi:hypothetical protein